MIRLSLDRNNRPIANISVYDITDLVNTAWDVYSSHEVIVNDMLHVSSVTLDYDTRGWSTVSITIKVNNYYINDPKPVETYNISFSFVEDDDECYNAMHDVINKYQSLINNADTTVEMHKTLELFVNEINDYYAVD